VKLITCAKYSDYEYTEKELKDIDKKIVYWQDPNDTVFLQLKNIESKFNLFNRNANLVSNTTERKILNYINEYIKNGFSPDIIILEWTEMVVLARAIKRMLPNVLLVASEHDVTFVGYKRKKDYYDGFKKILWSIKYLNEKKVEIASLRHCDLVLPHNAECVEILKACGIDTSKMHALVPFFQDMSYIKRKELGNDILFFGAMNRSENIVSVEWFIKNVMPELDDINFRFVVLGNNPNNELVQYESPKIHFTGFVDDISEYFCTAKCFVAPLLIGAGIKIKVLEALSSGIPVLTNDIGIEGIPAVDTKDYYNCKTAKDYSRVIHDLDEDYGQAELTGSSGKKCVQTFFSPSMFYSQYKGLLINKCIK